MHGFRAAMPGMVELTEITIAGKLSREEVGRKVIINENKKEVEA